MAFFTAGVRGWLKKSFDGEDKTLRFAQGDKLTHVISGAIDEFLVYALYYRHEIASSRRSSQ